MHAILPSEQAFCFSNCFWCYCSKMNLLVFQFIGFKSMSSNVTFDDNLENRVIFLSSSTHEREISDQSSPNSSNARRITFFSDIGLIWLRSVRRTFYRQFQKSPYLVTISSHSWDIPKSNFSALYLKDNQNGPSQDTPWTKISHFISKKQKKFLNYPKPFKSYRALESAILSWDTLYFKWYLFSNK